VNTGLLTLLAMMVALAAIAAYQRQPAAPILKRLIEQFAMLVPRMLCALVAAGFIAEMIPKALISGLLGADAGIWALPVAALTGLILPAGPVIAFAIAAIFAKSGATPAALVTFITSWTLFAAHRMMIYELPLLGASFLRLRVVSVALVPFMAGLLAMIVTALSGFGTPAPLQ
jgi:uncharacterized membrane protein YraQ (UPF0718 family)